MRYNIITVIVFLLIGNLATAQSHNEEVTIEGSYTPHIKKSERIVITPEMPKREFEIPHYEVNTEDFFYNYKVDSEPVSPMQYKLENTDDITDNFIKFGLGTRLSPDFVFRHYSDITRKMSLGLGIIHNSTWTNMKGYDNSKYMNNAFKLSTTNRFSGFQLHSYIDYHYDTYHLNTDNDTDTDKRDIHSLNVKLLANNNQTSYKSLYNDLLLDYNYSGIQGGMQENYLRFKAHLEHSNSWFRNSDGVQTLSLDIDADIDNISQTLFMISANPYLAFDGEYYNLHLGFRVDAKTSSTSMGGIYPDLRGSLYLFNRNFELYARLGGKTKINTLKEILAENPFIISNMKNFGEFDYEKTKIDFKGGMKFKIINKISAHAGIRYRKIDNHVFYVSSIEQANAFDIILNNCNILNFDFDLIYNVRENTKIAASFAFNKYDMIYEKSNDSLIDANEEMANQKAWYKPKFEFSLKGIYDINEQWSCNIATYVESSRYAFVDYDDIKKLKPVCDIQLGCDYNLKDNLSFYGEIRNLIHNKYQIYYDYPSYGFQIFVGFKYRF